MFATIDGQRIFFDVCGTQMQIEGPSYREKPVLLLLHGGPGFDHSSLRPVFDELSDVAQLIYLDHRGNGRSWPSDPKTWNLNQWGDDIFNFCEYLGIRSPIVLGQSFGGMVAQSYVTRHPAHPRAMIFSSTAPRMDFKSTFDLFEKKGGVNAREIAEAFWSEGKEDQIEAYLKNIIPLYNPSKLVTQVNVGARGITRLEVLRHFSIGKKGEISRMDFRSELGRVKVPSLVIAGEEDPITPPHLAQELYQALGTSEAQLEIFKECGHGPFRDDPQRVMAVIRAFIKKVS